MKTLELLWPQLLQVRNNNSRSVLEKYFLKTYFFFFSDKDFITEAYNAKDGNDILEAFDAYMSGVRLLPKDWPKDHKIDPPPNVKNAITGDFHFKKIMCKCFLHFDFPN